MSGVGNQRNFFRTILKFSMEKFFGHSCDKSKTRKFASWRNGLGLEEDFHIFWGWRLGDGEGDIP